MPKKNATTQVKAKSKPAKIKLTSRQASKKRKKRVTN